MLGVRQKGTIMQHDIFISHASEDKESFVAPLAKLLYDLGVKVWYDEFSLKLGDSLSRSIDKGLANSRFGVVILSKPFIAKSWPEYELRGLVSKEIGSDKVILPLWHGVSRDEVLRFSPSLANKFALDTSKSNLYQIGVKIIEIVRPDIHDKLLRLEMWRRIRSEGKTVKANPKDLRLGPIRHEQLPENLLVRIKIIHHIFSDVLSGSLEHNINLFRRELRPLEEITHWEKLAAVYLDATLGKEMTEQKRKEVAKVLIAISVGALNEDMARNFEHLSYDEVIQVVALRERVVPHIVAPADEEPT